MLVKSSLYISPFDLSMAADAVLGHGRCATNI